MIIDFLPEPVLAPLGKVVVAQPPRRQVMRQEPPRAPAAHDVEDGIDDQSPVVTRWPSKLWRHRQQRAQERPFNISKITRIRFLVRHPKLSTPFLQIVQVLKSLVAKTNANSFRRVVLVIIIRLYNEGLLTERFL